MKNYLIKLGTAGAATMAVTMCVAGSAMAGSVSEPGEGAGGAQGAPLPPGLYFVEEDNWGARNQPVGKSTVGVNINALSWSTPWTIAGARLSFLAVIPNAESGNSALGSYTDGLFNPFFSSTLAWNLGNGFNVSYTLGGYIPTSPTTQFGGDDPDGVLENRLGLSYLKDGWNFSANLIFGTHTTNEALAGHPDYFNADLTATKKLGKWEVGAVGFYSTDTQNEPVGIGGALAKQSQFALGAIVGYDWGPLVTQVYVTHDVYQQNYGGEDLRVWGRIIVPLGDPFAPAPTTNMYHK